MPQAREAFPLPSDYETRPSPSDLPALRSAIEEHVRQSEVIFRNLESSTISREALEDAAQNASAIMPATSSSVVRDGCLSVTIAKDITLQVRLDLAQHISSVVGHVLTRFESRILAPSPSGGLKASSRSKDEVLSQSALSLCLVNTPDFCLTHNRLFQLIWNIIFGLPVLILSALSIHMLASHYGAFNNLWAVITRSDLVC